VSTLTLYAGLGGAMFFVAIYLQQVAGYTPIEAGAAFLPMTGLMFVLSKRMGSVADRIGPRLFMGVGPIVAALGLLLLLRIGPHASYWSDVLPAVLVFGLGLASTVAPLTATVLGAVEEGRSGIASGVNNAIARVAGLLAIAVIGAVVAAQFGSAVDSKLAGRELSPAGRSAVKEAKARSLATAPADRLSPRERAPVRSALTDASSSSFHLGLALGAGLVLFGGVVSLVGIENPRRRVAAEECPGGAICGASEDLAQVAVPGPTVAGHASAAAPARA
jgi:hypothetical protein